MKLRLKNFRCYEDNEFDFGENGVTLISGPSGKGKTTLMMAIEFALFGSGNKLQTYGKKSCSVELSVNQDLKIYRQKGPNRLIVNDVYEDDAGEAIINEHFGSNMLACYIPQNIRKSFILMSPPERLEFLESFAFSGIDIQDIKSRAKSLIKKLNDEHTETIGSLKAAKISLDHITKPENVTLPIKCSLENREKMEKNEHVKHKNCGIVIRRCEKEIDRLKIEHADTRILANSIADKQTQVEALKIKLTSQVIEKPDFEMLKSLKRDLETITKHKILIRLNDEYTKNSNQLDELVESETEMLKTKISELESIMWRDMSKEETENQVQIWKEESEKLDRKRQLQKILETKKIGDDFEVVFKDTEKELNEVVSRIEKMSVELNRVSSIYELQKESYKCPHCRSILRLVDKELIYNNIGLDYDDLGSIKAQLESMRQDIQRLKTTESDLKKKFETMRKTKIQKDDVLQQIQEVEDVIEEAKEEFKSITEYQTENLQYEKELQSMKNSLKNGVFSDTIARLRANTAGLKLKISQYGDISQTILQSFGTTINEEELRQQIDVLNADCSEYSRFQHESQLTEKNIQSLEDSITVLTRKHIDTWGSVKDTSEIVHLIANKEDEINSTRDKENVCKQNLLLIEKYKKYISQLDTYNNFKTRVEDLEIKEATLRKDYTAACHFRDKIIEAESISITTLINNINTHAQFYLEQFFTDDPISVRLCAFKELKDGSKPQINLEIDYKGIEHDLQMLSGGEMSRVILAFTLALSEMQNSKFVMLDESTASLDQELTASVIEGIKEHFSDKLVLVIAHQVVQGSFDKVVKIGG